MIYLVKKMWNKGRQEKYRIIFDAIKRKHTIYLIENKLFLPIENAIIKRQKLCLSTIREKSQLKYCFTMKIKYLENLLLDIPRRNRNMGFEELTRNWRFLNKILEKVQIVENIKKYYSKRVPLKDSLEKMKISCGIEGHYFIYTRQIMIKDKLYNLHIYYSSPDFKLIANCGNLDQCSYKEDLHEPKNKKMSIESIKELIIHRTQNVKN